MRVRRTIAVVSRLQETVEERFERLTFVKMNVKDNILMTPEYEGLDLFIETEYSHNEIPLEREGIGRL